MYPIINTVFLVAVLVVNALANILPINGYNTGQLSAFYPNKFVPAGFTFAIWGVIYTLLLIWVGYFLYPQKSKSIEYDNYKIGPWFLLTCIFNIAWILAWHYLQIGLSLFIMLALLCSLIIIYRDLIKREIPWIIKLPISVYLGWICVATIANTTAVLVSNGIDGGEWSVHIAALMIIVATCLGLYFTAQKRDVFYTAVIIWALIGIIFNHEENVIQWSAGIGIALMSISMIPVVINKKIYSLYR